MASIYLLLVTLPGGLSLPLIASLLPCPRMDPPTSPSGACLSTNQSGTLTFNILQTTIVHCGPWRVGVYLTLVALRQLFTLHAIALHTIPAVCSHTTWTMIT